MNIYLYSVWSHTVDSSYWIPAGYGLLIPDFLLMELGFRIAIVTDSKTKPKSKSKTLLDSRIRIPSHEAKFRRQLAFLFHIIFRSREIEKYINRSVLSLM